MEEQVCPNCGYNRFDQTWNVSKCVIVDGHGNWMDTQHEIVFQKSVMRCGSCGVEHDQENLVAESYFHEVICNPPE